MVRAATAVLIGLLATSAVASPPQPDRLSAADLERLVGAYEADLKGRGFEVFQLLELSDALSKAGDIPLALAVAQKAKLSLLSQPDADDMGNRGRIVGSLASFGDAAGAEQLAKAQGDLAARVILLGNLGVGLAKAGNARDAAEVAQSIATLASGQDAQTAAKRQLSQIAEYNDNVLQPPANPTLADASEAAISNIAVALQEAGASDEALRLVSRFADGPPKVRILSAWAIELCTKPGSTATERDLGNEKTAQAVQTTLSSLANLNNDSARGDMVVATAEAVAICKGAAESKAFVASARPQDLRDDVLGSLTERLITAQRLDLAKFVRPEPDPHDRQSLFNDAHLRIKLGDMAGARKDAFAARGLPTDPRYQVPGPDLETSGLFIDLGDYDEAIATIQLQPDQFQLQQAYQGVVTAEIEKRDVAALDRTLPGAIEAYRKPSSAGDHALDNLYITTRALAVAGFEPQARRVFDALRASAADGTHARFDDLEPWRLAVVKGDLDGFDAGLKDALASGPISTPPNPALAAFRTGMALTMAGQAPTEAAIAKFTKQMPDAGAWERGPAGRALADIAADMAARGDIPEAMKAIALLEAHPTRNGSDFELKVVAEAQIKAKDPSGALATVLRIEQPEMRPELLLRLAAEPSTP